MDCGRGEALARPQALSVTEASVLTVADIQKAMDLARKHAIPMKPDDMLLFLSPNHWYWGLAPEDQDYERRKVGADHVLKLQPIRA